MNTKKKAFLVMAATYDYIFAVANVLIGLKKYSPNIFDDIIIYTDDKISDNDKLILKTIFSNIKFELYDFEIRNQADRIRLSYYQNMPYARYEMLKYLSIYEKVVWFDSDFLILDDIKNLLEYGNTGVAMSVDLNPYPKNHSISEFFNAKIQAYDMCAKAYASGLVIFTDKLKNPHLLRQYLYEKTNEYSSSIKYAEQGILHLMLQDFDIEVDEFPKDVYHCFPFEDKHRAKIIHFLGFKPWLFYCAYDEWYENHKTWIELGGSEAKSFSDMLGLEKDFKNSKDMFVSCKSKAYFFGEKRYQNLLLLNSIYNGKINNNEYKNSHSGAARIVRSHLSYKLGERLLSAYKNKIKIIFLPFTLLYVYFKHFLSKLLNKLLMDTNPNLQNLPLNAYSDYQDALKIKNYLTYRLGNTLVKHPFSFLFRFKKIYKEWKKEKSK